MSLITTLTKHKAFIFILTNQQAQINYQNYTLFQQYQHFFYNHPHKMENQLHQSLNLQYNQQQIYKLQQQFIHNKQLMFEILHKAPKVGVYKHQTKQHWQSFFKFYIDFLKSQQGPRGDCAKSIRQRLLADEEAVNKLLNPFKLRSDTHIRQIYKKIKTYIPCAQYTQMKKIEEAREKYIQNIKKFGDENSEMVKSITEGLIKKHGEHYDIKPHLETLKGNYVQKLKEANQYLDKLRQMVQKCQGYFNLLAVEKYFESYFVEWKVADSEMGKQSCKTGSLFQQKVFNTILPYIYYRQTHDKSWIYANKKLQVFQNLSWIPRNLGEIDIALGYKDEVQNRYFITTLIECKSRFFDLREAHRQVSLENEGGINKGPKFAELKGIKKIKMQQSKSKKKSEQKNEQNQKQNQQKTADIPTTLILDHKKFLSTKYGPAEIVQNHHFYIITTLPQNQFVLPIESKMKEGIEKYTRNMFLQDIQNHSQLLYLSLKQRFENVPAPLDWLQQYQAKWKDIDSKILVLR